MALKALLDFVKGPEDATKALYRQLADGEFAGKYVLDVEPDSGFTFENVDGLKGAYASTKGELDPAKAALEGYKWLPAPKTPRSNLSERERLKIAPALEADRARAR